jgi:hypothetical protein
MQSLTEKDRFMGVKYCLLYADSAVCKPPLRTEFLELIQKGRNDFLIYANVRDYLVLIAQALDHKLDSIDRSSVQHLLSDNEVIRFVWETATSGNIQYRMQISFIRVRQILIDNGASEEALPLTDELRSRLEEAARSA